MHAACPRMHALPTAVRHHQTPNTSRSSFSVLPSKVSRSRLYNARWRRSRIKSSTHLGSPEMRAKRGLNPAAATPALTAGLSYLIYKHSGDADAWILVDPRIDLICSFDAHRIDVPVCSVDVSFQAHIDIPARLRRDSPSCLCRANARWFQIPPSAYVFSPLARILVCPSLPIAANNQAVPNADVAPSRFSRSLRRRVVLPHLLPLVLVRVLLLALVVVPLQLLVDVHDR